MCGWTRSHYTRNRTRVGPQADAVLQTSRNVCAGEHAATYGTGAESAPLDGILSRLLAGGTASSISGH